jgi:DNA segregation ATPase FtsK/SpoIIIE, S-DNA-T family
MTRKGTSGGGRAFLRFLWLKPVRWFLLIVIIGTVIYLQRQAIIDLARGVATNVSNTLGWGIILIDAGLLALLIYILIKRVPSFLHWLRFTLRILGSISLLLAIWGVLAFLGLGGNFGDTLIAKSHNFIGIIIIFGLVVLAFFLIAPVWSARAVVSISHRTFLKLKTNSVRKTKSESLKATPKSTGTGEKPEKTVVRPSPAQTVLQSSQDLKQVTQDVWKRYGESSSLVVVDGWKLPPIEILDYSEEVELSPADNAQRAKLIEEALSSYGVQAKVVQINPGPTVTQFGLEPGWDRKTRDIKEKDKDGNIKFKQEEISRTRVKVERITSLANDLALTLATPSIRIEAPVPGKGVVGIEVPNTISSVVTLRGVVETSSFQKLIAKSKMAIALGKGAGGEAAAADLTRMPHLLIAGATGSGKTVCLNAIICSLLLHNTPNEVLFIMVDPKRVELTPFNSIPHLATPVIVEPEKAITTLRWLSQEMDRRYKVMASANVRNIEGYNKSKHGAERMPYLVLVIDELADLMMTGTSGEVEHNLCRLAQLARATGIHLVVATQRPSVDVITGLIKANFPTRISFAVTSQVDSRTILDSVGAEKLLGKGDMLYMPTDSDKPKRLQGCWVKDTEIEKLVYFWNSQQKDQKKPSLNIEEITVASGKKDDLPADALMEEARTLAREHGHISTSYLQRRLRIGYPRAARIMEQLEEEGIEIDEEEKEQGV